MTEKSGLGQVNRLGEQLLLAVKKGEETSELEKEIAALSLEDLYTELSDDTRKKTFWINAYNAYYQILRKERRVSKDHIYTSQEIIIAGESFSLDDMEHGILRRYKMKHALGFFSNPFAPILIKNLAVDELDFRIHFALNCGAKSCPPIAFYKHTDLDKQLTIATQSFLEGESSYDEVKKRVHTTVLFKWFRFDFGGEQGIRDIYKEYVNKDISDYAIDYNAYSWDEQLDNYV